jgi:cell division septum initiation protein DivIVA
MSRSNNRRLRAEVASLRARLADAEGNLDAAQEALVLAQRQHEEDAWYVQKQAEREVGQARVDARRARTEAEDRASTAEDRLRRERLDREDGDMKRRLGLWTPW